MDTIEQSRQDVAERCRQILVERFGRHTDNFIRDMRAAKNKKEKLAVFQEYERKQNDECAAKD